MSKKRTAPQPKVRLTDALDHYGDVKGLARFFDISPEAIMNWKREGDGYLPDRRALQVSIDRPELCERAKKRR